MQQQLIECAKKYSLFCRQVSLDSIRGLVIIPEDEETLCAVPCSNIGFMVLAKDEMILEKSFPSLEFIDPVSIDPNFEDPENINSIFNFTGDLF